MALDKRFFINTGKDGMLEDTNEADVQALVAGLAQAEKVVLYFHGGLVSKQSALAKAEELLPVYQGAGAHPVFFIWEAGLLEILRHNLDEINGEKIFKLLLRRVLKHSVGKLADSGPAKSVTGTLRLPSDIEVAVELEKLDVGEEPYAQLDLPEDLDEMSDSQVARFEQELASNDRFSEEVEAIVSTAHPERIETSAKGVSVTARRSTKTLMSPEVVDSLVEDRSQAEAVGAKGIFSTAKLVIRAGKILRRVIRRLRHKRGHGVYVTVVEEILRELYIANVGGEVWHLMKQETADTFANAGQDPKRGGWFFIQQLGHLIASGHRPEITLVGHSTGAVFISHLLAHADAARQDPDHPLPADFTFKNVLFLAPASRCSLFAETLDQHRGMFEHFRMFTMTDDNEKGNALIKVLYPRSLLYFVSGVVERQENGKSAFDLPIVGMQRYTDREKVYTMPEVVTVRNFLRQPGHHVVWSVKDDGPGLASNALSHSDFDEIGVDPDGVERTTMKSVQHIIARGI